MDTFAKGTPIDEIFKLLDEKLNHITKSAEEKVLEVYDNKPTKPFTSGKLLVDITQRQVLDCGCCYKLSAPVMDMVATELLTLQAIVEEVKKHASDNKLLMEVIDHRERVLNVIFDGIKELVMAEDASNRELYTTTMHMYAKNYRAKHGGESKAFDNISGLEDTIEGIIKNRKVN